MIKILDKSNRKKFKAMQRKNAYIKTAVKEEGLDLDRYYEQIMEVASGKSYSEVLESSFWEYQKYVRNMEIARLKLLYILKRGELYEYNIGKYYTPFLNEDGVIPEEVIVEGRKICYEAFLENSMEQMEKFVRASGSFDLNFVPKHEYAKYFENADYVFADEEKKYMVVIHDQLLFDVVDIMEFLQYSPESPRYSEKTNSKEDPELTFLVRERVKKEVKKKGFDYPLSSDNFIQFMTNPKRCRHYGVAYLPAKMGSAQYFLEQLSKVEDEKVLKELLEYKFDSGVMISNPIAKTMVSSFEWLSDHNEYELKDDKVEPKWNAVFRWKEFYKRKYKEAYAEWLESNPEFKSK